MFSLRELARHWNQFWFRPEPATVMGLYRIAYAFFVLVWTALFWPFYKTWFTSEGVLTSQTAVACRKTEIVLNSYYIFGAGDSAATATFLALTVGAVFLLLGLFTRTSTFVVFLCLGGLMHRDGLPYNAGDVFMRLISFYLLLSRAGHAFSLDNLIRTWHRGGDPNPEFPHEDELYSPWAQRLLQVQLSYIYFDSTFDKLYGKAWVEGTAVYFTSRELEFRRLSLPLIFDNLWSCRLLTWFTLVTEFSMATLVWFKECRYWVLLAALLLHLGIDVTMNIPLFEWWMIITLFVFVDPGTLSSLRQRLNTGAARCFKNRPELWFNKDDLSARRICSIVRRLDVLSLFEYRSISDEMSNGESQASAPQETPTGSSTDASALSAVQVRVEGGIQKGARMFATLSSRLPLLWPLFIFFLPATLLTGRRPQEI